ncbi:MAG: SIS domain-containing protein [Alphaproteobacteria bacterium]|nr:SIS domain-containing protein [Alphaproteobacteria bacterium]MBU6471561.1 SIS domain-containing protein [Alphaproteobacteria bacterium]MDE2012321.1 SIS domain-containing protein [Alphaproteobacteria bacterium]MDE2072994.1 SIS domain-containing protein [Alphaproteobacteria bacterium]MDE2352073.1 SIS domain-containing protein [Alphaproteobacteria bacterium]
MMFPDKPYADAKNYAVDYLAALSEAACAIDVKAFGRAADLIVATIAADRTIFACGNGGSAAISNHLLCDFAKGIQTDTGIRPKIVSLSSHVELITAIGNDISFEDIYLYQIRTAARAGDALLTISSSGNSENVVRAVAWARTNRMRTIALTGFDGGRSAGLADVNIHVPARNYGVVEDLHQSVMHILAQYTRLRNMIGADVLSTQF